MASVTNFDPVVEITLCKDKLANDIDVNINHPIYQNLGFQKTPCRFSTACEGFFPLSNPNHWYEKKY